MTTLAPELHEPSSADAKVQQSAPSPDPLALILQTATLPVCQCGDDRADPKRCKSRCRIPGLPHDLDSALGRADAPSRGQQRFQDRRRPSRTRRLEGLVAATTLQPPPWWLQKTEKPCGANRDRTGDLLNAIQALSQLSYSPSATLLYRARFVFAHSKSGRPVSIADFTVQKRALYFLDASLVRVVSAFAPMRRSGTKGDPRLHRDLVDASPREVANPSGEDSFQAVQLLARE